MDSLPKSQTAQPEVAALDVERLDFLESSGALDHLSELRRESRELDTLINDAAELFRLSEIPEMLTFVTSRLIDRFIPIHLVFLIELPDGRGIDCYSYLNMKPDDTPFPISYYKSFSAFFKQSPFAAPFSSIEESLGAGCFGADLRAYDPAILFPMMGIGGLFGVVVLGKKMVGGEYSSLERMYVDRLLRFLAICIQNRLHRERSITDPKTGLYNHAYFMKRLGEELNRVARRKTGAGVIMLDIDHFKIFNDTWGHLAGDEVLQGVAEVLKQVVRAEDLAARYGGEEFCVLVVDCAEDRLFDVAERIRLKIANMKVAFKDDILSVTASFGCCPLDASWHGDGSSFIERADHALYQSKKTGRNRSTLYRFGLLGRASAARVAAGASDPGASGPRP